MNVGHFTWLSTIFVDNHVNQAMLALGYEHRAIRLFFEHSIVRPVLI